jgi:hypothetical protein
LQKRWLERHNHQVGGPEIVPGREYWFPPKRCERIDRAAAEVDLSSMTQALPKASKRGDRCLRLGGIEGDNFTAEFLNQFVERRKRLRALRSRRTIPASSSETEQSSRVVALSKAARRRLVSTQRRPARIAGKSKFVVSEDFVIAAGVQDWQGGDFLLDCIHLFPIDRAGRSSKLCFERTNYCVGKSDTHPLAYLFSESISCGIFDAERAHGMIVRVRATLAKVDPAPSQSRFFRGYLLLGRLAAPRSRAKSGPASSSSAWPSARALEHRWAKRRCWY